MTVPNQAMRDAWDGEEGAHWTECAPQYAEAAQRITPYLYRAASIGENSHVLDVGCGFGGTTLHAGQLARSGSVLGVDLSSQMLELARKNAVEERLTHVEFQQADAQVDPLGAGTFEVAISRFGVMFFEDPVAAFTNIRAALKPGGRLVFLTWATFRENPWVLGIFEALAQHIELPQPPPGPMPGPGPFSFADPDQIRGTLTEAGFHDIEVTPVDEDIYDGPNADAAYAFVSNVGFVRAVMQAAPDEATKEKALASLREFLEAHEKPDGVWIPSRSYLVKAQSA